MKLIGIQQIQIFKIEPLRFISMRFAALIAHLIWAEPLLVFSGFTVRARW